MENANKAFALAWFLKEYNYCLHGLFFLPSNVVILDE